MSVLTVRGGTPHVLRRDFDTTGSYHRFAGGVSNWLQIKTVTNPCKVYFTQADFTADTNYIAVAIASATEPHGFAGPVEALGVWIKGDGGTASVELVSYERRG